MTDPELETFKSGIDLRLYATGLGYAWDRKESWRGSTVMRAPDGEKVIIKRDADGHLCTSQCTGMVTAVLYSFTGGADGARLGGGLVRDVVGNLYGTAPEGGILTCQAPVGCGTVFKLRPPIQACLICGSIF